MIRLDFTPQLVSANKSRISHAYKKLTKLVKAIVFIDEDEQVYKVKLDYNGDDLILELTPDSYDLKCRENIFLKVKTNNEKRLRIIRTPDHARAFPGSPETHVPFAPNWVVNGYIVKKDGKMYFDFNDIITIEGYRFNVRHII